MVRSTVLALAFLCWYRKRLAAIEQKIGCSCLNRSIWDLTDSGVIKAVPGLSYRVLAESSVVTTIQISKVVHHCAQVVHGMFPENWTDIRSEVQVGQGVMDVCPQLPLYCALDVKPFKVKNNYFRHLGNRGPHSCLLLDFTKGTIDLVAPGQCVLLEKTLETVLLGEKEHLLARDPH